MAKITRLTVCDLTEAQAGLMAHFWHRTRKAVVPLTGEELRARSGRNRLTGDMQNLCSMGAVDAINKEGRTIIYAPTPIGAMLVRQLAAEARRA